MPKIEQTVVINKPVAECFAYFNNPANNTKWQGQLKDSKLVTPGPVGVGSRLKDTRELAGQKLETEYEITEFEPNKKVTFKSSGGPISYVGTFTFEPSGNGTKFTSNFDFQVGGVFKLMEGMVVSNAQKQFETDSAKLKQILEAT